MGRGCLTNVYTGDIINDLHTLPHEPILQLNHPREAGLDQDLGSYLTHLAVSERGFDPTQPLDEVPNRPLTEADPESGLRDFDFDAVELLNHVSMEAYRRTRADDVRFCSWAGQDDDGKKHQNNDNKEVFPWDGASDTRVRLADMVCTENSEILTTAFQRGILRASPTEVSDAAQAEVVTTLLRYYRDNKLRNELRKEASLLASYGQQYGFGVLHVKWDREVTKKMMPITMEDLVRIASEAGEDSALGQLPGMIADPDQNDLAAEVLEAELGLKRRRAKKLVRELREDGATELPTDVVTKNCPQVVALKPFDEVFFPPETVELQSTNHVFRRVWMTEFEMRELVTVYDYDEKWDARER